jgi:hypothetical protein
MPLANERDRFRAGYACREMSGLTTLSEFLSNDVYEPDDLVQAEYDIALVSQISIFMVGACSVGTNAQEIIISPVVALSCEAGGQEETIWEHREILWSIWSLSIIAICLMITRTILCGIDEIGIRESPLTGQSTFRLSSLECH